MSPEEKIWNLSNTSGLMDELRELQIVMCYGHFNIIHPGHIRYLEHAKTHGQRLIVAVQGDQMLTYLGNSHSFPAHERALGLASLQIVDRVIILDKWELDRAIKLVRPQKLVLGKEFERERKGHLHKALMLLKELRGQVFYHAGEVHYATTELLNEEFKDLKHKRWDQFKKACLSRNINLNQLQNALNRFKKSRLLVLGDTIVDQYIACDALGMSAEAPVLVVRQLKAREYLGGAAIVAAHVRSLGAQCQYLSVVGNDDNAKLVKHRLENFDINYSLIEDPSRPTTFKIRYMVENQKLFRVSHLQDQSLSEDIEMKVIERLQELAPHLDGILVSDFVYGVITDRILEVLQELSELHGVKLLGDLQCSSQIGNVGKFKNFHLLTPTEKEARVALDNRDDGIEIIANTLIKSSNTKYLLVKMGAEGFIAYGKEEDGLIDRQYFPALFPNPVDITGAGDSLLACLAVGLCSGNNLMVSAALGACMASLAVQTVGNQPVHLEHLQLMVDQLFLSSSIPNGKLESG